MGGVQVLCEPGEGRKPLPYENVTPQPGLPHREGRVSEDYCIITAAIKHINCHAGLDPASRPIPDSRCHENDGFDIYLLLPK
jgi:hypothetical protein